ncbi:MAG: hypothetical protein ACE5FI_05250 [Anaerolineales bacterium]
MLAATLSFIAWLAAALLAVLFLLIARFYQRTSGEASGYLWFSVPAVLLLAASVRELQTGFAANDLWTSALRFVGGALLVLLCSRLFTRMTARQRR